MKRRTLKTPLTAFFISLLCLAASVQANTRGLEISASGSEITVTGGNPGGQFLVAGTLTEARSRVAFTWEDVIILEDTDGDGAVSWTLPFAVTELAAIAAVDLGSGATGTFAGGDPAERIVPLESPVVLLEPVLERVTITLTAGNGKRVVLVRPGSGSWQGRAELATVLLGEVEGNSIEKTSSQLEPHSMAAIGDSPAFAPTPQQGDLVLVLNRAQVQLSLRQLTATDFYSP